MKKRTAALALVLILMAASAGAELTLFVGEGTITDAQAQALSAMLSGALGERFAPLTQEEAGMGLFQRVTSGGAAHLAIVRAEQARPLAREGLLLPLEGFTPELVRVAQPLIDAGVVQEQLFAAPLFAREHMMAVSAPRFEQAGMAYLLDDLAHPVWYPSEMVQALDELALEGVAGLDIWPPAAGEELWLRALLQGAAGLELTQMESGGITAERESLENALVWLSDLCSAGLIGAAEDRQTALERFLSGETAVFVDWTPAESEAYAREMKQGRIVLLPYPAAGGMAHHAVELIAVCALRGEDETENAFARRAAALVFAPQAPGRSFSERNIARDGAPWMQVLGADDGGATLSRLLCDAVSGVMKGEAPAAAAGRVARAMQALSGG